VSAPQVSALPGGGAAAAAPGTPLVTVERLHVGFGSGAAGHAVVREVSFTIGRGEAVAIVGESGSGKSVTSRALVGLAGSDGHVRASRLEFDGTDLLGYSERDWRRLRGGRIGLVLQDALVSLDPLRQVGREIEEVLRLHARLPAAERRTRVIELLTQAGVPEPAHRAGQIPNELSGGLRQRALIASALAGEPDLIIADEPTTALDVTVQAQVLRLLKDLVAKGRSLLLISHDLAVVADVADRVLVMRGGEIVEQGPVGDVLSSPQHEYTRLLIDAVPSRRARREVLARHESGSYAHRVRRDWRSSPDGTAELVRAEHVTRRFPGRDGSVRVAVDDVSFALRSGETLGIVGESGSGKSTTARLVLGLDRPDSGRVLISGQDWADRKGAQLRAARRRVQAIYQDALGTFDPRYRVEHVLAEALIARAGRSAHPDKAAIRRQSIELLELVGLGEQHLARRPLRLSGGQRQRVAIARALAPEPDVLVCDEPVSALDVSVQAQVLDVLLNVQEATGVAYLFISHDLSVVHHMADRVLVLRDGNVVEEGDADEVFLRPKRAYTQELVAALPSLPVATQAAIAQAMPAATSERK
jgi:peptide/nickel transport system ATP-binding protein